MTVDIPNDAGSLENYLAVWRNLPSINPDLEIYGVRPLCLPKILSYIT